MNSKLNWEETVMRLYQELPQTRSVDWSSVFRNDPKILGSLINDIIKVSVSQKGRPGKRSAGSEEEVAADFLKLTDSDYSDYPFHLALKYAMGKKSLRQTALVSGVDKMIVHRFLNNKGPGPTIAQMEDLAKALKKDPSYFVEYRAAYICNSLYKMLCDNPENSVVFYKKIKGR
jgi:hypothetical protein